MRKPRVLLINPPETEQVTFNNPPLALLYLAGTLKKHKIQVNVIDGFFCGWKGVEKKIKTYKPNIVGIPCLTPFRHKSYRVAKIAKRINPEILTIFGGVHATIMHHQLIENYSFIDIVVRGEGEQVLLKIAQGEDLDKIKGVTYRENDRVEINQPQEYVKNLDEIPFPAWELIDLSKYPPLPAGIKIHNGINLIKEPRVSVVFSRGCPGRCTFCSSWWIWRGWRCRSGKNMADEMELLYKKYGVRHFCFADDCMTADAQKTIDLCNEIIKRKLKIAFSVTTRTDVVNLKVLKKLKEAGCYCVNYGIESASHRVLKLMNKKNTVRNSEKAVAATKKAGIKVLALMMTGNVGDNFQTVNQSVRFLQKTKPEFVGTVGGVWVFPGTKIYSDLKVDGKMGDDFWLTKKPMGVYKSDFTGLQMRYIRMSMEKRKLINPKKRPWLSPHFLVFYALEKIAKSNRFLKKTLVKFYDPLDKIVKRLA